MDEQTFWRLLEESNGNTLATKLAALEGRLRDLELDAIVEFEKIRVAVTRRAHTSLLWAAAYLICEGCSDDGFDYFKGWLVLKGKAFYEATLSDPDSLADLAKDDYPSCEEFLSLAGRVYRDKTGVPLPRFPVEPRPHLLDLWDFEDLGEMSRRLPRLTSRP